jgi:hypothetical protein
MVIWHDGIGIPAAVADHEAARLKAEAQRQESLFICRMIRIADKADVLVEHRSDAA